MTQQERAEQLMAKGPVWLVRRVMELEDRRDQDMITLGQVVSGKHDGLIRAIRSDLSGMETRIPGGAERKAGSP